MKAPGEKLVIKLWESIADKGIGALLKPWQIRREGRATIDVRREELLALTQAETDATAIRAGLKTLQLDGKLLTLPSPDMKPLPNQSHLPLLLPKIEDVAERNTRAESIRREISISKAILHAEEELAGDTTEPPADPVSDDWLLRWRDCAAGVSSDELQSLWGKVLAGEVKSPGRYSLRTMEFLRNLSQEEAKAIEKLSPFVISNIIYRGDDELLKSEGINFSSFLSVQELGVISGVDGLGLEISWPSTLPDRYEQALTSHGKVLMVKHNDASRSIKVTKVCKVTALGHQILQLGTFQANEGYLRALGTAIKLQGFDVELGQYISISATEIQLFNLQPL
ncbi:MAG: DUF2806 domain-containing protein [Thermodesulfovibrionales bacterium]|nr:DUF2806 domain-containing protein [Thermodesulfovibrionales bacterium]